MTAQIFTQHIL